MLEIDMGADSSIVILEMIFQSILLEGGFGWDGRLRWHDGVYVIHQIDIANCHVIAVVAFHPKEPDPTNIWVCCRVIWPGSGYAQSHQLKKPEQVLVDFSKSFGP